MKIELPYGRGTLGVEVPAANLDGVFRSQAMAAIGDVAGECRKHLAAPIGTPPLDEMLRGKENVCLVISDVTRYLPYPEFLPQILDVIRRSGLRRDKITILVGTGLHRPSNEKELTEMLGPQIASDYKIVNHVARRAEDSRNIGKTSRGTPINVNKLYLDADFRILIGFIEPHLMAGYSGGRKSICPGICCAETISITHGPDFLEHDKACYGVLAGNPFHEDISEVAEKAGAEFILNITLNEEKQVSGIFAGDLKEAFNQGVSFLERHINVDYPAEADIVITSGLGYPLDATFYQTIKGMVSVVDFVKKGGTVIIASKLSEGVGSAEFGRLVRDAENPECFMKKITSGGYFAIDQWMLEEMCKVLKKARVMLYSDGALDREEQAGLFVRPVPSVEKGIEECLAAYGPQARIAVLPQGIFLKKTTSKP